jgi:hypothetical protein
MKGLLILSCLVLVQSGLCLFPTGAPPEACQDMTPQHGPEPQPNPSPYSYDIVEIEEKRYHCKYFNPSPKLLIFFVFRESFQNAKN